MKLDRITVVAEPPRDSFPGAASSAEIRAYHRLDEFAEALASHARVPVSIIEARLCQAPTEGMLLVWSSGLEPMMMECPAPLRAGIAARTVLLNGSRGSVAQLLERFRLAGAVLATRYGEWRRERGAETGSGLRGLRRLAQPSGAECYERPDPMATEHYCLLGSKRYADLPALMAAYLAAAAAELP